MFLNPLVGTEMSPGLMQRRNQKQALKKRQLALNGASLGLRMSIYILVTMHNLKTL